MAKKNPKADETKNTAGDALPTDNADSAKTSEADGTTEMDELQDTKSSKDETDSDLLKGAEIIEPIAFQIKLKAIHPQDTYGRCGYRFNKNEALEISRDALTGEQIITLSQDPYLEFVPVVEGNA
ncbi:transcriptional regulator [Actinobacillus genomosp. 2]|uniref:transcriptional regulator n=1 Tax=Actinobacillus genomosp. 2 TaxID=230709 RepID=UPI0024414D37|nr:transcriptional regulator [Actinobacillus genomosp. 2]WGE32587.1 transcriptional regulator [Actinobacillus genomosp. 2]